MKITKKIDNSKFTLNILSEYYKDIAKHKLLNKNQELLYGKLMKKGKLAENSLEVYKQSNKKIDASLKRRLERLVKRGNDAKFNLIVCNLRLVVRYAKKYEGHGLALVDLIQEGNRGLFKAVEKYDYGTGNRFSTYATY